MWARASLYSRSASGLTGPSCSRRRPRRSSLSSISARCCSIERLLGGPELAPDQARDPLQLRGGLATAVAQVRDPHLGFGDPLADLAQASLKLGLLARAGAKPIRDVVGPGLAERPPLERRRALAGRVASIGRRLAEGLERGEQRRLAARADRRASPGGGCRAGPRAGARPGPRGRRRRAPRPARRHARARPALRAESRAFRRLGQCRVDPLDPGLDRVVGRLATARTGELAGQRAERRAPSFDRPRRARRGGSPAPRPAR